MNHFYDQEADVLFIDVRPRVEREVVRTEHIDSGTLVDVDDSGFPVSIEVINPNREWPFGEIIRRFGFTPSQRDELWGIAHSPAHTMRRQRTEYEPA